jgi:hypothetical protein
MELQLFPHTLHTIMQVAQEEEREEGLPPISIKYNGASHDFQG